MNQIKVIYILGCGHSGSTMLDLFLGSHPEIISLGEFSKKFLERFAEPEDHLCTCKETLADCDFWTDVEAEWNARYGFDFKTLRNNPNNAQTLPKGYFETLLKSVCQVTGTTVLCDSSKSWPPFRRYRETTSFEVFPVHLIRDGRGVAFSMHRKYKRLWSTLVDWAVKNLACHFMERWTGSQFKLRYEDFCQDPLSTTEPIFTRSNLVPPDEIRIELEDKHNVGGNHLRFEPVEEIKQDTDYLDFYSVPQWWAATVLASIPLKMFKYSLRKQDMDFT